MRTVLFDFDGTITYHDTMRSFAEYAAGRKACRWKIPVLYALLVLRKTGLAGDDWFKERFMGLLFAGWNIQEASAIASDFISCHLDAPGFLRTGLLNKMREHITAGDAVYIISANFDFFLAPLLKLWKLNGIIATKTEVVDGKITGRLSGPTCKGKEKCVRARLVIGEEALRDSVVYGDSEDGALMSVAGKSFFADNIDDGQKS